MPSVGRYFGRMRRDFRVWRAAHANGFCFGRFGHQGIFVADQSLRVELERFAHELGDAVES